MNIHHEPNFDVGIITEHYSKKDGVPVTYVCTTDLNASDVPVDVYYRETPHPQFGNHYFGLYYDRVRDHMMITNADVVEDYDFGMIKVDEQYQYSSSHHDYKSFGEKGFIDGGRVYCRSSSNVEFFKLRKGKFVKAVFTNDNEYVYPGSDCQV